jgi:hypothetical protein
LEFSGTRAEAANYSEEVIHIRIAVAVNIATSA